MTSLANTVSKISIRNAIFFFALFVLVVPRETLFAQTITSNRTVTITARVGPEEPSGTTTVVIGSTSGASHATNPTAVTISGIAYPFAHVIILKDGSIAGDTVADAQAIFSITLGTIPAGMYTLGVYALDTMGTHSATSYFSLHVSDNVTVTIAHLFISPSIILDKTRVRAGDTLLVSGYAAPLSSIVLDVGTENTSLIHVSTQAAATGFYHLVIPTTTLTSGSYWVSAQAVADQVTMSDKTNPLKFSIADTAVPQDPNQALHPTCGAILGDITCDKRVDIIDFSILKQWYKKNGVPKNLDLDGDGSVTLSDFSILAYNWTG
jgi:hypothetical protein